MIQKNWTELIKANKKFDAGTDAKRSGTLVMEPLERGFGLTLGNALRRVLLSSLQGAAVTAIHVDGVLHEFSSIPGVREDVTDIVLNVKAVAVRMHGDGPKRIYLKATGPGEVTAGQIETGSDAKRLATVVAEPLERGFGLTLGNALRRIMLSSLQGAAVTQLAREIQGWGPELAKSLKSNAATNYGFSDAELDSVVDPRMVKVLHDAYQWRKMQDKKPEITKRVAEAPQKSAKPTGKVDNPANSRDALIKPLKSAKTAKARNAIAGSLLDKYV